MTQTIEAVFDGKVLRPIKQLSLPTNARVKIMIEADDSIISSQARVAGLHLGDIWTSEDFDASLPDEFWTNEA